MYAPLHARISLAWFALAIATAAWSVFNGLLEAHPVAPSLPLGATKTTGQGGGGHAAASATPHAGLVAMGAVPDAGASLEHEATAVLASAIPKSEATPSQRGDFIAWLRCLARLAGG
jgi:hypothetical protein